MNIKSFKQLNLFYNLLIITMILQLFVIGCSHSPPKAVVQKKNSPDGLNEAIFSRYKMQKSFQNAEYLYVFELTGNEFGTRLKLTTSSIEGINYGESPQTPNIIWSADSNNVTFDFGNTKITMDSFEDKNQKP